MEQGNFSSPPIPFYRLSSSIAQPTLRSIFRTYMMDPTIDYIKRYLLEEEIDELTINAYKDEAALQDIEKPFYEILGQKYLHTQNEQLVASSQLESDLSSSSSSTSKNSNSDTLVWSLLVTEFHKGIEEGKKFLLTINNLATDCKEKTVSADPSEVKYENSATFKLAEKDDLGKISRSRSKILRETLQLEASLGVPKEIQGDHDKLYTLLIHSSEAVAIYDQRRAQELLNKIRMQSSPNGNGIQRLASVLADALEARLAGVGSEYFRRLIAKLVKSPDIYFLKGHHMSIIAAPFTRVYYFFLTAIFLMSQGMPEKCMLREYARSFNVPFEYKGIVSQWESIRIEELTINDDEVVVVNCLFGLREVKDETFAIDSPRDRVLKLIRQIKPQIFIHAESNRSCSSFFLNRFRQVLSTYYAIYDIVDSTIPHKVKDRKLLENVYFVPDIINSVACEGSDLKEKPETLKQWQRRNLRACFEQLPVNTDIVKECKNLVRDGYDNRYFIQEDDNWLLQGWKGRVISGATAWKPKLDEGC
ncbi:GRAS transcription factor [Rhynchospora pubera]|uniref:GRAS transcription factor n=1 Tax=Rhynchospora pubera TaxID=906938 RepID=A0AAV8F0X7_9POAL|nr:GRAS transcription factor [Rhynchospora pubera]